MNEALKSSKAQSKGKGKAKSNPSSKFAHSYFPAGTPSSPFIDTTLTTFHFAMVQAPENGQSILRLEQSLTLDGSPTTSLWLLISTQVRMITLRNYFPNGFKCQINGIMWCTRKVKESVGHLYIDKLINQFRKLSCVPPPLPPTRGGLLCAIAYFVHATAIPGYEPSFDVLIEDLRFCNLSMSNLVDPCIPEEKFYESRSVFIANITTKSKSLM